MKKLTKSVEVLPIIPFEVITGAMKNCSFRVTKTGRNIVYPRTPQKGKKKGRAANILKSASQKWQTLNKDQIQYWRDIAKEYTFWSNWTAFVSSFLLSLDQHGLDYTMANNLSYIYSKNRLQKYKHFANSKKRNARYKVNPEDYAVTEETLKKYPIQFDNPIIFLKLEDSHDINIGLKCSWMERTDKKIEYQYYPDEVSDGNTGRYIRIERARIGDELYEPFAVIE